MGKATTAYLLTCAAIGVATGLLIIPMTALSTLTYATFPPLGALTAGAWVIGFVIAMRLIEKPGAAVLTGLISGLVAAPFSASGPAIVVTNVMFAAFIELPFLVTLYRKWGRGLYYVGALSAFVLYALWTVTSANMTAFPWWVVVLYVVGLLASAAVATWLGLVIADRLRAAGVARLARRRAAAADPAPVAPVAEG
ncbi:ECF transporter S component [Microbacterium sp. bgisy203]|uniref:ECF transporter S component n=1 Tax=Microbacterium sp. bgisy203 TaxID=3413799 RepID=UPI003D70CEFB